MAEMRKTVSGAELLSRLDEAPDRVRTEPASGTVTVRFGGTHLARSSRALRLIEGDYPVVLYVPRADADMDALVPSAHTTFCPLKGHASYYSVRDGGPRGENAVWSYEDPFAELAQIRDHLAFYTDRVTVEES